jgi:hypothetical protein
MDHLIDFEQLAEIKHELPLEDSLRWLVSVGRGIAGKAPDNCSARISWLRGRPQVIPEHRRKVVILRAFAYILISRGVYLAEDVLNQAEDLVEKEILGHKQAGLDLAVLSEHGYQTLHRQLVIRGGRISASQEVGDFADKEVNVEKRPCTRELAILHDPRVVLIKELSEAH